VIVSAFTEGEVEDKLSRLDHQERLKMEKIQGSEYDERVFNGEKSWVTNQTPKTQKKNKNYDSWADNPSRYMDEREKKKGGTVGLESRRQGIFLSSWKKRTTAKPIKGRRVLP